MIVQAQCQIISHERYNVPSQVIDNREAIGVMGKKSGLSIGKYLHMLNRNLHHNWATLFQSSRRPSIAFNMVISSVYSMSLPTGIPMAIRVTFKPGRRKCSDR